MEDYNKTWYNNEEWELKYIITVARKPSFKDNIDLESEIDEIKEIKGDYDITQEKSVFFYENAVFVHRNDSRTRFVLRDDLMDANINLSKWNKNVQREDVLDDVIIVDGRKYPYYEDIIPDLESRDFSGRFDKLVAFFRETPVKEIKTEKQFLNSIPDVARPTALTRIR